MKNWKTTGAAICSVVAVICMQLAAWWDGNAETVANWNTIVPVLVAAAGLIFAKDA